MPARDEELIENITATMRMVPSASPGVVLALSAPEPRPMLAISRDQDVNAYEPDERQAVQGVLSAIQMRDALMGLDPKYQLSKYASLDEAQRRMLGQVGYVAPHVQPENRGWWSDVVGVLDRIGGTAAGAATGAAGGVAVGGVVGSVAPGAGTVAGGLIGGAIGLVTGAVRGFQKSEGEGNTLDSLGWVVDDGLHAYRTVTLLEIEGEKRGKSGFLPWTWSPKEWARAWRTTGDDIQEFSVEPDEALRQFGVELPPQLRPIAADFARGMDDFDLLQKYGPQAIGDAQQHPLWDKAISTIGSFALSPGRQIAHALGLSHIPGFRPGERTDLPLLPEYEAFNVVSGTGDALVRWFGDPANVGFGGVKLGARGAARLAHARGLEGAEAEAFIRAAKDTRAGLVGLRRERDVARYGITNAEDVRRVAQYGRVQTGFERISRHFRDGPAAPEQLEEFTREFTKAGQQAGRLDLPPTGQGIAGVIREFPELTPMAEDLAKAAPQNAAEVQAFFEAKAGLIATLGGRAAGFAEVEPMVPHIGRLGAATKTWPEKFVRAIESLEGQDDARQIGKTLSKFVPLRRGAIGFRRFTNLVPKAQTIDVARRPGEALEFVRQTALYALPRAEVDTLVNAWTAADVGGKRQIYTGMLRDLSRRLGDDRIPELRSYFNRLIGGIEDEFHRPYGLSNRAEDVSRVTREGGRPLSLAVAEHQLTTEWALPSFREIVKARRTVALYKRIPLIGDIPDGVIDVAMDKVWKPLLLLRLGFPIRAGGEEVARHMLENGFIPALRQRLAASTVKGWQKQREAAYFAKAFDDMGPSWSHARDYLAGRTSLALSKIKTGAFAPLAGDKYLNVAERLLVRYGPQMVPSNITSLRDVGGSLDKTALRNLSKRTDVFHPLRIAPGRGWKNYTDLDEFQSQAWHAELARHVKDPSFRIALLHADDANAAEDAIYQYLASDEAAEIRKLSPRADHERMGFATQEEALRDWARVMRESYWGLTHDPNGAPIPEVVDRLRGATVPNGKPGADLLVEMDAVQLVPAIDELAALPPGKRPLAVAGREVVQLSRGGPWETFVNWGFGHIGRIINWTSRQPIFMHEYARALDELAPTLARMQKAGVPRGVAEQVVDENALTVARERAYSMIDSSEVRSQFAVMNRNLFPFWHAQEQFIKRWSKAVIRAPHAVERAQLAMMGLRHSGAVHTDANGEDFFYYPGVMFSMGVIGKVSKLIFGKDVAVGVPVALTGRIRFVAPGIESPRAAFLPSPGPLLSVPLAFARRRFPEFGATAEDALLGSDVAVGRPIWEQLVPSSVSRLYKFATAQPESDAQMASAMIQALQHLDSVGQGLPENATAEEQEWYQDRVRGWARALIGLRALFGFAGPAPPQAEFTANLQSEFLKLLQSTGDIDKATTEFLRRHPGADAYTVFRTETTARGTRLDATAPAGAFMREHADFIKRYGGAAAWFIPPAPGEFDFNTWRDQMAFNLRRAKAPEEVWTEIKVAQAASIYYPSRDAYEAQAAQLQGPAREQLDAAWAQWRDGFLATHPVFDREHFAEAAQRDVERKHQLATIATMLQDPTRPKVPQEEELVTVMGSWDAYRRTLDAMRGDYSADASARRQSLTAAFRAWGATIADPTARQMFQSLIEPQLR